MTIRRPSASVVICAYTRKRWEHLSAAVASVSRQSVAAQEVIIVIDHNPALLAQALAQFTDAVVVASTGPKGLSGARNTGVSVASAQVVAFLDDDAEAAPDWLERMLDAYEDDHVIGVGGHVDPAWAPGGPPAWFPAEFGWVVGCSYTGLPTQRAQIRNPIGANMSFRRTVLMDSGGFSSSLGRVGTLPLGCEETELSIRARASRPGSTVVLEPSSVVRHHVPGQRATWTYFRRRCWSEGLSKAQVSRLVGADAALSAERGYVTRTLARGVAAGLRDGTQGSPGGLRRAAAITAGLAVTTSGYAWGRLVMASQGKPADAAAPDRNALHPLADADNVAA